MAALKKLVKELFEILDTVEESMNGNEFHPTNINSCRVVHIEKLNKILPRMKQLTEN